MPDDDRPLSRYALRTLREIDAAERAGVSYDTHGKLVYWRTPPDDRDHSKRGYTCLNPQTVKLLIRRGLLAFESDQLTPTPLGREFLRRTSRWKRL